MVAEFGAKFEDTWVGELGWISLSMGEVTNVLTGVVWSELNQKWVKGGGMETHKLG